MATSGVWIWALGLLLAAALAMSQQTSTLQVGLVTLTQSALNDAPERFFAPLQQQITAQVASTAIESVAVAADPIHCEPYPMSYTWLASDAARSATLLNDTLQLVIQADGIHVSAQFTLALKDIPVSAESFCYYNVVSNDDDGWWADAEEEGDEEGGQVLTDRRGLPDGFFVDPDPVDPSDPYLDFEPFPPPYYDENGTQLTWADIEDPVGVTCVPNSDNKDVNTDDTVTHNDWFGSSSTTTHHLCQSAVLCSGTATVNAQIELTGVVGFQLLANGSVQIVPTFQTQIMSLTTSNCTTLWAASDGSMGFGQLSSRWFIGNLTQNVIQASVAELQSLAYGSLVAPTSLTPFGQISISYAAANVSFVANQYVNFFFNAVVYGAGADGIKHPYTANETAMDLLPPSDNWAPPAENLHLLYGMRLSSTLLDALVWAAHVSGAFHIQSNTSLLDACIQIETFFADPVFTVVAEDLVDFYVANGYIQAACNTSGAWDGDTLLHVLFQDLGGSGHMVADTNNEQVGVALQVDALATDALTINVTAPDFPIPRVAIDRGLIHLLNASVPQVNKILLYDAFFLPSSLVPDFPNATVHIYPQPPPAGLPGHGYIELLSACTCDDSSKHTFRECGFCNKAQRPRTRRDFSAAPGSLKGPASATINATVDIILYTSANCTVAPVGTRFQTMRLAVPSATRSGQPGATPACQALDDGTYYTVSINSNNTLALRLHCTDAACVNCSAAYDAVELTACLPLGSSGALAWVYDGCTGGSEPSGALANMPALSVARQATCPLAAGLSRSLYTLTTSAACLPVAPANQKYISTYRMNQTTTLVNFECDATCAAAKCKLSALMTPGACNPIANASIELVPELSQCAVRNNAHHDAGSHKSPGLVVVVVLVLVGLVVFFALVYLALFLRRRGTRWSYTGDHCQRSHRALGRGARYVIHSAQCARERCEMVGRKCGRALRRGLTAGWGYTVSGARSVTGHVRHAPQALSLAGLSEWWGRHFMRPRTQSDLPVFVVLELVACQVMGLMLIVHGAVWCAADPLTDLAHSMFSDLGLSAQYLRARAIVVHLDAWSGVGRYGHLTVGFLCLVTSFVSVTKRRVDAISSLHDHRFGSRCRVAAVTLALAMHVTVMLLPGMLVVYRDEVHMNTEGNDYFFTHDPETAAALADSFGLAFASLLFSMVGNILLYFVHALPMASIWATSIVALHINEHHAEVAAEMANAVDPEVAPEDETKSEGEAKNEVETPAAVERTDSFPSPIISALDATANRSRRGAASETTILITDQPVPATSDILPRAASSSTISDDTEGTELSSNTALAALDATDLSRRRAQSTQPMVRRSSSSGLSGELDRTRSVSLSMSSRGRTKRHRNRSTLVSVSSALAYGASHEADDEADESAEANARILALISRFGVLNSLLAVVGPVIASVPVTIFYQSSGNVSWWGLLWLIMWLWQSMTAYTHELLLSRNMLSIFHVAFFYVLPVAMGTSASLYGQAEFTSMPVMFYVSEFFFSLFGFTAFLTVMLSPRLAWTDEELDAEAEDDKARQISMPLDAVPASPSASATSCWPKQTWDSVSKGCVCHCHGSTQDEVNPLCTDWDQLCLCRGEDGSACACLGSLWPSSTSQRRSEPSWDEACEADEEATSLLGTDRVSVNGGGGTFGTPAAQPKSPPSTSSWWSRGCIRLVEARWWQRWVQPVLDWASERKERADPATYGLRLPFRRLFFLVGVASVWYIVFHTLHEVETTTTKETVIEWIQHLHMNVTWPPDSEGGNIFDPAFHLYDDARRWSLYSMVLAACLLTVSFFLELLPIRKALYYSHLAGFASLLALFITAVIPSIPNYVQACNLSATLPKCAPEFNRFINLFIGDMVGLACSAIFSLTLLPLLLAVVPSLVRTAKLVLVDQQKHGGTAGHEAESDLKALSPDDDDNNFASPSAVAEEVVPLVPALGDAPRPYVITNTEAVRAVFRYSSMLVPLLCGLPLVILYQLGGDDVTSALIVMFVLLPLVVPVAMYRWRVQTVYWIWLLAYFGPLVGMMLYQIFKNDLKEALVHVLNGPAVYIEIAAEICVANVVVSDILYRHVRVTHA
ncbi:uncharacterized protein MONBRDRAFT_10909 [Monosiga brevicollis MX1]|uniref:Uncharacterized protein n=1 Tax=Monosiga brevicollis TaxID=81824 RepID=A9V7L3_MONBE|nr:uncharacterized protein MONBRDRAFT_10909 [Monosiga brevicollis MX1]EDQ86537.1 predicted protein [Monosiga brevicollis MX1]|eukprot:XP_001748650.1 hypothetical protein [Monosiga brevicollis MX1]